MIKPIFTLKRERKTAGTEEGQIMSKSTELSVLQ